MDKDLEHLKLLAIFHYILAGLCALHGLLCTIYFIIGSTFVVKIPQMSNGMANLDIRSLFMAFGSCVSIGAWIFAFLIFKGGRGLAKRRSHTFCFVVAIISCLYMPFGTILGIFTIIVINRPSVKALFARSGH